MHGEKQEGKKGAKSRKPDIDSALANFPFQIAFARVTEWADMEQKTEEIQLTEKKEKRTHPMKPSLHMRWPFVWQFVLHR